ncbi:TlyA family RNA methyltransferase [Mycoplasma phocoenae]|uniref:TlyA family RNA methyltransferase n=1 Tax=Mycoplasma phocoenae TaxID=754517 RepID=A0A858U1Y9_9MOLU|nr:TlyA family RNA methyltransferase [Mycoplasma phocoenae]QJG67154.1 TlyA family RNA methyltransferase [Mycoplasma phocoenae]
MSKIVKKKLVDIISEKFEITINEAEKQIRCGNVTINSEKIFLPLLKFDENLPVELLNQKEYVSRGAYKLLKALKIFNIDVKNKICVDLGSSTGGFVQVLLKHNAKKVYAVDVGTNQLDYSLRINPNVVVFEQTNLKDLTTTHFNEMIDIFTCDVSFISLKYVFGTLKKIANPNSEIILLIKPQFEASSKYVSAGGYVEEKYHPFLIDRVKEYGKQEGFECVSVEQSPILGQKSKNIEYISLFKKTKE